MIIEHESPNQKIQLIKLNSLWGISFQLIVLSLKVKSISKLISSPLQHNFNKIQDIWSPKNSNYRYPFHCLDKYFFPNKMEDKQATSYIAKLFRILVKKLFSQS